METVLKTSVQWFLRVLIRILIEIDIPQLSSDGIQFGKDNFHYTYSLQSSSIHSFISLPFDATSLEYSICFGDESPPSTSYVVNNRESLNTIPSNVKYLWFRQFDTSGLPEFSFNRYQSLKTIVIGNGAFWSLTGFELNNLPSLQSIEMGRDCFYWGVSFSLTGMIDWVNWIYRSS